MSDYRLLFAHGAGADKDSEWMLSMNERIERTGLSVHRFNFPYMDKRREDGVKRPPDKADVLLDCFRTQIAEVQRCGQKLILMGKSMGGRMASLLAAQASDQENFDVGVVGVICLGYPFHPPRQLQKFKGEHLSQIQLPTLILQGERDPFGTREEVAQYVFSPQVSLQFLPDGDHSFMPRKRSGFSVEQNMDLATRFIAQFIADL